jgi:hypothetical protein
MAFFHLPIGHAELHVDRRDPHPTWIAAEALPRRKDRQRRTR